MVYNTSSLRPVFEYSPSGGYAYHEYFDDAMIIVDFAYQAGSNGASWSNRADKYLDGRGRVATELAFTVGFEMDVVDSVYDQWGRAQKQTRPYRRSANWVNLETPQWTNYYYDTQDRTTSVVAPDGSTTYRYYNESTYPSAATAGAGNTIRVKDAWGRERWARSDEQNRLVEVVEPDPAGSGAVASNGLKTSYTYNPLGNLTNITQGSQTRSFKYDSLGRLTNQKLAERDATLDDNGNIGSTWSDYFKYDNRGNLIERRDARRVKTSFNYNNDPLNRLYQTTYDKSAAINAANIFDSAQLTYTYVSTGDKTRISSVEMGTPNSAITEFGEQSFTYDSEGRLSGTTQSYGNNRNATTSYLFDTLDRISQVNYPAQVGQVGSPVRQMVPTYDISSRLNSLTYNGTVMATNPVYNASSQTTSLTIGSAIQEQYVFDQQSGLLTQQKVMQGATSLVDLEYNYTTNNAASNVGVKAGQLTFVKDNKNTNRNRQYSDDKMGRLTQAQGGTTFSLWSQTYGYDRYGNRISVTKSGNSAGGGLIESDGLLGNMTYNVGTNRLTTSNFTYDAAGNQTQTNENGLVQSYRYDAAGRLAEIANSAGTHTFAYGASNQRLQVTEVGAWANTTLYAWDGGSVVAEFNGVGSGMAWTKSYVYLGGRLLATESALNTNTTETKYHHPDRLGTRLVTSATGAVVSENIGLPFGNTISGESVTMQNSGSRKRFTSYDRSDTTKLDYAVNRSYSPAQGRFTQVDPIGFSACNLEHPQSLNLYAYCGNDPINLTDPDGLFWKEIGNFFKSVGKLFSKVAGAVLKVLNNTYVSWALTILGFVVGIGAVAKALGQFAKVLTKALDIVNKIRNIAGYVSVAGEVLQGNFKSLGLAIVGAIPAIIEDSVIAQLQGVAKGSQRFSLKAYWQGFKDGVKDGFHRVGTVFKRALRDIWSPVYGFYCAPGYGTPAGEMAPGVDSFDNGVCKPHDEEYVAARDQADPILKDKNSTPQQIAKARLDLNSRLRASDRTFFIQGVMTATRTHLLDRAFGVDIGTNMRFLMSTTIGGQALFGAKK